MVSLYELLVDCADRALVHQVAEAGAMPAGHNGPWKDPETPVRNTGHWAITFAHCHEHTGEERFLSAAESAVEYVLSAEARPHSATFHHRLSAEKDQCNGLIGQAWSIETLVVLAEVLDRPELVETAEEVFLLHPYDEGLRAWHPVEIDGTVEPIDMTFNHQLWFAAAGGLLADHPATGEEVDEQVQGYLDDLEANMTLLENGLVYHPFKPAFDVRKYAKLFFEGVKAGIAHRMVLGVLGGMLPGGDDDGIDEWVEKSIGYHSFNLYAFGLLREAFPDHSVWESEAIQRTLAYARSDEYVESLRDNPYGYPYNVSGIEMAYVLAEFDLADGEQQSAWLQRQLDRTFDADSMRMERNNPDAETLTARLYEATRVPNVDVTIEERE